MEKTAKSKTIIGGALTVSIITVLYRILGFLRESITASYLGNSATSDAYYIAYSIPYTIVSVVSLGAIASAAIPFLSAFIDKDNHNGFNRFLNNTAAVLLPILLAFSVAAFLFSDGIVSILAPGFDANTHLITVDYTKRMIFLILPMGMSAIYTAAATSVKSFSVAPLSYFAFNLILVFGSSLAYYYSNIYVLTYSVLAAAVFQLIVSLILSKRACSLKLALIYKPMDPNVKVMLLCMIPICLSQIINMSNTVIGRAVASSLDEGSVASLNYADKVYNLPLGIVVGSVASVVLPFLSDYVNDGNTQGVAKIYNKCIWGLFLVIIPIIVIMVFFNEPVISALFEHGNFDAEDTVRTAATLAFFAAALPGAMVVDINNRIFYAYKQTQYPMIISGCIVALNVVLSINLSKIMQQNGIALSLAISMITGAIIGRVLLLYLHKGLKTNVNVPNILKLALCGIIMAVILYFSKPLLFGNFANYGLAGKIGFLLAICVLFIAVYALLLSIMRLVNTKKYLIKFKNKLLKRA